MTMMVSLANTASAAVVVSYGISAGFYSNNSDTINPGNITFDAGQGPVNLVPPTTNPSTFSVNTSVGIVTFSGTGAIINNPSPHNSAGVSAAPYITGLNQYDTTNYLSVLAGRSETLTFSQDVKQIGFYWGSIDSSNTTWNRIEFWNNGVLLTTISGANVPNSNPSGDQSQGSTNKYVKMSLTDNDAPVVFDQVKLFASTNSFELDNVSFLLAQGGNPSVPEASTWAMMILGFLGVGFLAYRRKDSVSSLRLS